MIKSISANELLNLVNTCESIDLIDVRTPIEFRSMHVAIARNEPLDRLDPKAIQAARHGSSIEPLYVICRSGGRSRQACEKFFSAGVTNVINVEGGTMACAAAGAPIVQGKKAIPLNCQVQIITGLTVLAGTAMTMVTGNFYWLALPIVMGAGLVFSGLTNTCAMGTVLARMPWNQVKPISVPPATTSNSQSCTEHASRCCN
ncbi:MAG: rhodanese-like domain-containing protein [Pirellula sp.]